MVYVINENKHYFVISKEAWPLFDSDYLQRAGCEIFTTQQAMYDHLVREYGYRLREINGNDISISLNDKNELVESLGRNIHSVVDDEGEDYNDWLAAFTM